MKTLPGLFLFLSLNALCFFVFAQRANVEFRHIGTGDGLSQSNVVCIMQDSQGFMWFGTRDGLNKYDGYKVSVFKNIAGDQNSLSNNYIQDIKESKNGYLWIATWGGGVNRYDRNKNQFTSFKHDPNNINSISSDFVNTLLQDSQGNLWIGTEDGGLNMFDVKKNQFVHYTYSSTDKNSLSDVFVKDIFEDSEHNLWIGTGNGGLNLLNRQRNIFTRFQHDAKNKKSISSNNIYAMFEDSKHRFWIGTNGGGMELFNKDSKDFSHFTHDVNNANSLANNNVHAINEDSKHNLWIGTENGGLSIFDPLTNFFQTYENNEFDATGPGSNSIYAIYKDTKDNIWIGTFSAGVDLVSYDAGSFIHYKHMALKNSLSNNKVICIYEDAEKNMWMGTDGGGLNLFDPKTGTFTYLSHHANNTNSICGNYVLSICEDAKGNLWIGTWADGITVFNRAKNTFTHFKNDPDNPSSLSSNNAWTIFKDNEQNIWIGTYGGGLDLFNAGNNSFKHYKYEVTNKSGLLSNKINSIYPGGPGKLWVSTDGGGLNLLDKKNEIFTHFLHNDKKNSICNNSVSNLFEDKNKNLWIGTMTGLSMLDNTTKLFTTYTTEDGLSSNVIWGILEDDKSNLWISTNKGISKFNPLTKAFKNFGIADGLQADEFKEHAYFKSSSGAMYFGGNNGFNQFFPANIKPVPFEPPLVLTNFQVFNKDVQIATSENDPSPLKKDISETKEIVLPYKSSVFSFGFASLNYTIPEKKQYSYKLENFDKTWNESGTSHSATYTNLDPGNYIFKVRGLNNDGNWSSRTISVKLTITPPFWLTWWFKTALVFFTLSAFILFYHARVNIIKKGALQLERQVQERTQQLAHAVEEEQKSRQEAEHARYETENANKDLERKNKEMEQFAYIASHDLQEPLRTTSSFAALLQKQYQGRFDEKADKYFTFILDASARMKELIKNLLDYSRIGNKKELEQVDCNEIIDNVLADLGTAISEAGADIRHDKLPVISGYATELKQLFQNLVTNAIKFRKKDTSPEVSICVQREKGNWHFSFKDNGIGIDEKHNEKIFVIFQRLHTRAEYEGTGIGLSHCKKIVELHKGRIWVDSIPGEGSTFHFTIPEIHKGFHKNGVEQNTHYSTVSAQ